MLRVCLIVDLLLKYLLVRDLVINIVDGFCKVFFLIFFIIGKLKILNEDLLVYSLDFLNILFFKEMSLFENVKVVVCLIFGNFFFKVGVKGIGFIVNLLVL